MSALIVNMLEELEEEYDINTFQTREIERIAVELETGKFTEATSNALIQGQKDLDEQMDFTYFKRMKQLEVENKKLKNDLRLCAEGLIPHGMVGGIVQTEREKRHKAEEENKRVKEQLNDFVNIFDGNVRMKEVKEENERLKEQLAIKEAEQEEES